MSDSVGGGLPIWNGKNVDPMQWDNYSYAVQGVCTSRGLSALLWPEYTSPKDQEDRELKEKLMGILLQTTRDLAGMVVHPYADAGDGVGAWRALLARYGNDNRELRQTKQIEYVQKVFETRCVERNGILGTMHTLEHLFTEMDKLDCILPESFKRNVVLLQLRSVAPEIYIALAMETNMSVTDDGKICVRVIPPRGTPIAVYNTYGGFSILGSMYRTNQQESEVGNTIIRLGWLDKYSETSLCI